jgi:flagellar biosynthetic protein FliO
VSLGLVCLVAYLAVRWLAHRGGGPSSGHIRILGRCFLEPRRSVYLLEVGGRCFLVGIGDGPMSLLAEIDHTSLPAKDGSEGVSGSSFADVLGRLLRRSKR